MTYTHFHLRVDQPDLHPSDRDPCLFSIHLQTHGMCGSVELVHEGLPRATALVELRLRRGGRGGPYGVKLLTTGELIMVTGSQAQ